MNEVREVVVGVRDRDDDGPALRWAAREAMERQLPLRVVHAYTWTPLATFGNHLPSVSEEIALEERTSAQTFLEQIVEGIRAAEPGIAVSGQAVVGHPIQTLRSATDAQTLLVLGSRLSRHRGPTPGSVVHQLSVHAAGPVAIVETDTDLSHRAGVTVDITVPPEEGLRTAFAWAAAHGSPLTVFGYLPPGRLGTGADELITPDPQRCRDELDRIVAPWSEQYPSVPVEQVFLMSTAADRIASLTRDYALLVVDRRPVSPLERLSVGTINARLLHHASCPVLVIGEAAATTARPALPSLDASLAAGRVVVGLGGTPATDLPAVDWAAAEADRRACPLLLVTADHWDWLTEDFIDQITATPAAHGRAAANRDTLDAAETRVRDRYPDLDLASALVGVDPVTAMIGYSEVAELVVVGSHRLSSAHTAMLGSVGLDVIARAHGPVVVVAGPGTLPGETGHVVVGIDGGPDSEVLLGRAFEEASLHRCGLRAVLAWRKGPFSRVAPHHPAAQRIAEAAGRALAEAMAGWQEKYPDVRCERAIVCGSAADALLQNAQAEELIVVGRHAHGLADALPGLGGTTHRVLGRADCPVLVLPIRSGS